jgi:uncharacterized protein YkwD
VTVAIAPSHTRPRVRRRLSVALAAALATLALVSAFPAPAAATTSTDMAGMVLGRMNSDRVAHGLVSYRSWPAVAALAQDRAQRMADTHTLSHAAAGLNIGATLTARGLQWYGYGEIIGWSTAAWGRPSVSGIYDGWKGSAFHWGLMLSRTYNYAGVGVARAKDGSTFIAVVFTESRDHTRPTARNRLLTRSGTSLHFSWSGRDPRLQTHTAGLRSFDVQYRVDGGAWRTIRNDTAATSLTLYNRAHGHHYGFRVQSADRRGNLSAWTTDSRVWVP